MLKTAPCTLPYSAEAPSWSTSTVSTASVFGHGVELMSVPSIWYEFSLMLLPSDCAAVLCPTFELALTPGAELIKSKYEKRRTGAFITQSWLYAVLTCDEERLTTGDSPVTVTASSMVPTFIETSSSTTAPTSTGMASRRNVVNPVKVYSRSYVPGGRTGNRYVPVSDVTTEGVPATPAPRSVTVTPGSTLPDSSTILPIISHVVRCAAAGAARPNAISRTAHRHFITPPTFLQPAQRDQRRADVPRSGCAGRS